MTATAASAPIRVRYESEVPPWVVVQRRMQDLGYTQEDIIRIAFERYGIAGDRSKGDKPISEGHISEVISGKKWPGPDRAIAAILLVLGLTFKQVGLDEHAYRPAAAMVRGYRAAA